ncbi:FadR/GntR family transcriptional regulator [Paracoccus zhejiangensis]|uniref:GntR family transcriptional regulator n=1 Tax=Paracoccus zhejiangensis TaxID=1077935 RepID=A0A2H5F0G2_9RHOB|nr:FadR/GntR family transcriptional regulator [Paracoccus zhejiangensis]AUH65038.1 GntR family transcriptional regulator [Paracoccus zhejiangensis]
MTYDKAKPRTTLADKVYHLLFTRITNGEYEVNQKLPPENALSVEFGVSRPILRAAMERLRDEGLIYSRQGAGSYVRLPVNAPVGFARVETLADIQRCYEFRLTLESDATRLAAGRRNQSALEEIDRALALLRDATGSMQHREDADFAFHLAIAKASNNQYYEATMRALRDHINVGMKMHGQSLMSDGAKGLEDVLAEHTAIREAIQDKRGEDAARLMRGHIEQSRDRLFGGGLIDLQMRN